MTKKTSWFATYCSEVSRLNWGISTAEELCEKLIETRRRLLNAPRGVEGVEGSLPTEPTIKKLPTAAMQKLDMRYALLLIYFERSTNEGGIKTKTAQRAQKEIDKCGDRFGKTSHLLQILAKEAAVRSVRKFPRRMNAWETNALRIKDKYPGFYILFRLTSEKNIVAELFGIEPQPRTPRLQSSEAIDKRISKVLPRQTLKMHWFCGGDHWRGDLVVGHDKFAGLLLKDDLLMMPDPVTLTLMRHKEDLITTSSKNIPWIDRPVLTGLISGTNEKQPEEIFRTPLALYKIPNPKSTICSTRNFNTLAQSQPLANFLNGLSDPLNNWEGKTEMHETFTDRHAKLHRRTGQKLLAGTDIFGKLDLTNFFTK